MSYQKFILGLASSGEETWFTTVTIYWCSEVERRVLDSSSRFYFQAGGGGLRSRYSAPAAEPEPSIGRRFFSAQLPGAARSYRAPRPEPAVRFRPGGRPEPFVNLAPLPEPEPEPEPEPVLLRSFGGVFRQPSPIRPQPSPPQTPDIIKTAPQPHPQPSPNNALPFSAPVPSQVPQPSNPPEPKVEVREPESRSIQIEDELFFEARTHFQSMIDHLNNLAWKIFHVKDMTLKCDRCPRTR